MPLPGRRRAVGEDVAQVAVAAGAQDFDPQHPVAAIGVRRHVLVGHRLEEARPAGARVELRVRGKERQAAADARVDAVPLVVEQRAAERPLGPMRARNLELLGRQLLPPLGLGFLDTRGESTGPTSCP